jgi:hypothetical protein
MQPPSYRRRLDTYYLFSNNEQGLNKLCVFSRFKLRLIYNEKKQQCKIGALALILFAEYGFAQTEDNLTKEKFHKGSRGGNLVNKKRGDHRICTITKNKRSGESSKR